METKKKSYNLVIGIVALIVIILLIAIIGYFVSKPKPLVIQGEAEATEYRVSGKVTGRIDDIYVREGQSVQKGDTIAHIDSPEVRAKLAQADAAKAAASAQSLKARNGARTEQIQGAYQLYQQKLYDQKVISAQKYDETKAQYDASVAQTKAAKSMYDMTVNGARREDKEAAQALVDQANGAVMEVESYLGELYLVSPASGIVSQVYPHNGELVGAGSPVASVLDLSDIWFTFNVREDYLHGLKQGDKVRILIPALDNKEISATVNYICVRESYATWKATKETGMYDAKTFEVRAIPDEAIDGIRPGMTGIMRQ